MRGWWRGVGLGVQRARSAREGVVGEGARHEQTTGCHYAEHTYGRDVWALPVHAHKRDAAHKIHRQRNAPTSQLTSGLDG